MLTVRSIADLDRLIVANLHRVPRDVDAVVGIPRSGTLAASALALHLQLPLADFQMFLAGRRAYRRSTTKTAECRSILLVDDTVLHGTAMRDAVKEIRRVAPKLRIVRTAIFDSPVTPDGSVDLAFERLPGPRAFAWNLWKHKRLDRWAFDMDGVFCRDPSKEENDDGPRYLEFLRTAEPRFLPTRPIGWIITARLEKYREETLAWLDRHRVTLTGGIVMMNLPDKAARMARGDRGGYKAEAYAALSTKQAELYVESDRKQAHRIAERTGRAVWCVETQTFYPAVVREPLEAAP